MPKKNIILAGGLETRDWAGDLERDYHCLRAPTMVDALDTLRENPGSQLMVSETLPIHFPEFRGQAPEAFDHVPAHNRGVALIQYARANGLLDSSEPAHLATVSPENYQHELPEGVTALVDLNKMDLAMQIRPNLRGGFERPQGPRTYEQ